MQRIICVIVLISVSGLLAACGTAAPPVVTTPSKPVNIALRTSPSPARLGDVELTLTVTDGQGKPIEGARVDLSAEHTEMSGMNMSGAATEQGGGRYSVEANFSMNGNWKLTVYVRKDTLDYREEIGFPVQ
jgi:hypothetical protein